MSVKCIGRVLDASAHAGTELLMLVVLADYSDDDGNSYPAVASLARKCRMKPRNANYILNALQASGELRVLKNEGPKGTNRYRIMLDRLGAKSLQPVAPPQGSAPPQPTAPLQGCAPLQRSALTPAMECAKPLHPIADEPSLNRQEPSKRERARKRPETAMPEGFDLAVSQRVRDWAARKSFTDLDAHLEHFVGKARAKGYVYVDWDDALMNAIRDDWAGVRKAGKQKQVFRAPEAAGYYDEEQRL